MLQSLKSQVSQVLENKNEGEASALTKVVDAVKEVTAKIDASAQQQARDAANFAKSVIDSYKSVFRKDSKDDQKQGRIDTVETQLIRKSVEQIVKMGASPNTFWTGVGHFHPKAVGQIKKVLADCGICGSTNRIANAVASAAGGGGGKRGKKSLDTLRLEDAHASAIAGSPMAGGPGAGFSKFLSGLQMAGFALSALASKIGDMFEVRLTDSFKGVLINSNKFRENLRATLFQTQGFVQTNRELEKSFIDIGESVIASGVSRAHYEKLWVENLQRGFAYMSKNEKLGKSQNQILERQVKTHKSVQTSALSTATALGLSADSTNEMFMNWHMQLGMSANELANMGRSMRQISLSTGLTGANLEKAMRSAEGVMRTMRDTGALTDLAAKNVMSMTATAQKLGVEDTIAPLLKAMSGGTNMFDADMKSKKFLNSIMTGQGAAGRPNEMFWAVRSGDILRNKELMNQGQQNMAARARQALSAAGVENAENIDLSALTKAMQNMSSQQKALVQSNFENMVGALPGEFERVYQTFEENKKTEGERLKSINDEIKKATVAGMGGADSTKALVRKKNEMETGNIQTMFGKISDKMQQGMKFEDARLATQKELSQDFGVDYATKLTSNLKESTKTLMDTVGSRAKDAGKSLNELLQKRGMTEVGVKKALESGTADQRDAASKVLNEAMQEIAQLEKTSADPIASIQEGVRLINAKLGEIANRLFFSSDLLIQVVFWVSKAGVLLGSILTAANFLPNLFNLFSGSGPAWFTKALGPLAIAGGAIKGMYEAKEAGRTTLEGATLGALTGGAKTGSFLSSTIGLEKGGTADKALGVAGGAAWGALIGSVIPVIGTGVGALIGATVEIVKLLTEGTTILADILSPIQELISGLWKAIKGIGKLLWGIITLDFSKMFSGLYDIVDGIVGGVIRIVYSLVFKFLPGLVRLIFEAFKAAFITFPMWLAGNLISGLKSVFVSFPMWLAGKMKNALEAVFVTFPMWLGGLILSGLKSVFIEFPKWIATKLYEGLMWLTDLGSVIKTGLSSLADNEWVGPIFTVLSEAFNTVYDAWMEIYKPLKSAFDEIYQIFADIGTFWSIVMDEVYKELKAIYDPIAKFFGEIFGSTGDWNVLQIAVHVLAQGIAYLLKPLVVLAKVLAFVLKVVAKLVTVVAQFYVGLAKILKGLLTFDGATLQDGLSTVFGKIPAMIWEMFNAGFTFVFNNIKKFFGELPKTLWGLLLSGLQLAFVDFPNWLYETVTNGLKDLGTWIYDHTIGAILDRLPDWMKNAVGGAAAGIGNAAGAVAGLGKAAGKVGGGMAGAVAGGMLGGPVGGMMGAKAGAAILDWINPFNFFQEGTQHVKQPGLAVLHEGEMVVPKKYAKMIAAVGNGPYTKTGSVSMTNLGAFEGGQGQEALGQGWLSRSAELAASISQATNPVNIIKTAAQAIANPEKTIKTVTKAINYPAEKLYEAITGKSKENPRNEAKGGVGLGLFDPENVGNAMGGGIDTIVASQSGESANMTNKLLQALLDCSCSKTSGVAGGMGLGLFDPVTIGNAMDSGVTMMTSALMDPMGTMKSVFESFAKAPAAVFEKLKQSYITKANKDKSEKPVADAGKAMYYEDSMATIMPASSNIVDALMSSPAAQAIDTILGKKGETSTNLMDYSDATKGTVSPQLLSMMDAEHRVAQEKYGSMPSGYSIPGMDGIESYLAQEQNILKVMVEYLAKIESNTSARKTTQVIGSRTDGLPPEGGLRMRRISTEQSSGEWDNSFGDYSPSSTTMGV